MQLFDEEELDPLLEQYNLPHRVASPLRKVADRSIMAAQDEKRGSVVSMHENAQEDGFDVDPGEEDGKVTWKTTLAVVVKSSPRAPVHLRKLTGHSRLYSCVGEALRACEMHTGPPASGKDAQDMMRPHHPQHSIHRLTGVRR